MTSQVQVSSQQRCKGDKACPFPALPNNYCTSHQWVVASPNDYCTSHQWVVAESEKTHEPKWQWLKKACVELKEGESFTAKKPLEVKDIAQWVNMMRANISKAKAVRHDRFSIRRLADSSGCMVTKIKPWSTKPKLQEQQERQGLVEKAGRDVKSLAVVIFSGFRK